MRHAARQSQKRDSNSEHRAADKYRREVRRQRVRLHHRLLQQELKEMES